MFPPVFTLLVDDSYLSALLGANPFRVFPFGNAPQNVEKPYVTYTVYDGTPVNSLGDAPDRDTLHTQIDVWAEDGTESTDIAKAIRDLLETHAHMTSFTAEPPEETTGLYRCRMDFDFLTAR